MDKLFIKLANISLLSQELIDLVDSEADIATFLCGFLDLWAEKSSSTDRQITEMLIKVMATRVSVREAAE